MTLLEALALAQALEVNLDLEDGKVVALPKENLTEALRAGVKENLGDLKAYLEEVQAHRRKKLLHDLAAAGVKIRVKDGKLYASPREAVGPLQGRIAADKQFLIGALELGGGGEVFSEAHTRMLVRMHFNTEPHEAVPTAAKMGLDPKKAAFYKESGEER